MENLPEVPPMSPTQPEKTFSECITPPPPLQHKDENSQNSGNDLRKTTMPDRLKVPKAFKFPERYTSPTDMIMSPVTQGLLARNRRGGALLPPSINLLKPPQDSGIEGVGCGPTSELKFGCDN
ncbi:uncharacterized protein LOC103955799 isoform X2 [Pyrus x bretschneideri]|uniref:uncharacterized protein LOC103955799 isoform X2 n=1 Tax=Pyrus x bretschneideri TaxID=225117 RepID=UPI000511998B|nr:uncharacterized protein LOC103955799 isoform X2 [Pyrus x bretschneideri]